MTLQSGTPAGARRHVALFVTCLTDTFFPRVGEAVVRVLRHFGCDVAFPEEQTCCGQPAHNSGFAREATAVGRRLIQIFEPYPFVVTPSASCATMVKRHLPELLADDEQGPAAERLSAKTHEFGTFLEQELSVDLAEHLKLDEPFTHHYPCHAREIYSPEHLSSVLSRAGKHHKPPRRADLCCGFGGVFAADFPRVSGSMLRDKLDDLAATGAGLVISNEGGCTLNMCGGAHRDGRPLRFKHLAVCLAESLGLMEPES